MGDGIADLSQIVFGCASVGGRVSKRDSLKAMSLAFDRGVSGFDVARSYGYGEAERVLGDFISDKREQCVIASKAGIQSLSPGPAVRVAKAAARTVFSIAPGLRDLLRRPIGSAHNPGNFDPDSIRSSVETSLRELRTDRIDVLLLHCPPTTVATQDDVFACLADLKQQGKILRHGISVTPEQLRSVDWPEVDAYQYPAESHWRGPALWPQVSGLRLAHQLRGGGTAAMQRLLDKQDERGEERLGDAEQLELLLRGPIASGYCDAAVVSMFTPQHLIANVDSFNAPKLSDDRLRALLDAAIEDDDHARP